MSVYLFSTSLVKSTFSYVSKQFIVRIFDSLCDAPSGAKIFKGVEIYQFGHVTLTTPIYGLTHIKFSCTLLS